MKISLCNKRIWLQYLSVLGVISSLATLFSLFYTIKDENKGKYGLFFLGILIVVFFINYFIENFRNKVTLKINGLDVNIFYGDIFNSKGLKVIPFNEYFDTLVDNGVIAKKSLNGQFIEKYYTSTVDSLDNQITEELRKNRKIEKEEVERYSGKTLKYELGTTVEVNGEHALVAFTKFDNENRAFLSKLDYLMCLDNLWKELNRIYAQRDINLPLLGSGISRIGNDLKPQDYLYSILHSLRISNLDQDSKTSINIVLYKDMKKDIDLFKIKSYF